MDDAVAEAPVTEPQSWAEGRSSSSLYEQLVSPSSLNMEGVSKELLKASGKCVCHSCRSYCVYIINHL